jgi:hypothetical protein
MKLPQLFYRHLFFALLLGLALRLFAFAISFPTLAQVASPNFFLAFFFIEHPWWFRDRSHTVHPRSAATIRGTHLHACLGRRVRSTRPK